MGAMNDLYERGTGLNGGKYIADTVAYIPESYEELYAIQVLTATVFTTIDGNITGDIVGAIIPAGFILYGVFTEIELASGSVIVYNDVVNQ